MTVKHAMSFSLYETNLQVKIIVFWNAVPCSLADIGGRFGDNRYDDEGRTL
jgi:hypothetical protein